MPRSADDDREGIRRADEYLTARYEVVVDDIVLRTWGNGQAELVLLLLDAAVQASGGHVAVSELWPVARGIAFPDRADAPWGAAGR